jgi:integrase
MKGEKMIRRRGNGEGCLYHKPNGSWRALVTLQGRRLTHTFKTRGEAQVWIRQTLEQIDNGMTYVSVKRTLAEHLNTWIENEKPVLRPSSWIHYEQLVRMYIIPNLGNVALRDLRVEHVQAFYSRLIKQNVGITTIRKVHHVLHHAVNLAVESGVLIRNPVSFAHPPKKSVKEMKILDESEASRFLISIIGHRWEALFRLEVVTGMRQMEVLGLKWDDLDWLRQTIKVERQLVRPDGTGVKFLAPKTRSGKRVIDLDEITIQIFRNHYERQQAERLAAGDKWQEYGLIFTCSVGTPIDSSHLRREFYKLLENAGLPRIRFHDLRHTAASLMLNHGVPAIVVSKRLGHARVSITEDVYGHLVPGMQAEAAKLISDLVTPVQLYPTVPGATLEPNNATKNER